MEKYVFSGTMTQEMHDRLLSCDDFEPIDILVSQVDRGGVKKAIEWKRELVNYGSPDENGNYKQTHFCRWFFCDSGAFSVHTGKANVTQDEYIEYINSIADDIDVCAQLDTIPGKFGIPKSAEDYEESAKSSWKSFLYMRNKVVCPEKVMPVFHMGEDVKYLKQMLEYRDEQGHPLDYIGLSPANDAGIEERSIYLRDMYDVIKHSSNPKVKTHVYGFTALSAMSKYPLYSADSITYRILAAYGKIITEDNDVISVSKRTRKTNNKNDANYIQACIQQNNLYGLKKLEAQAKKANMTLEELQESSHARSVFNLRNIQKLVKTKFAYRESNLLRPKKFF